RHQQRERGEESSEEARHEEPLNKKTKSEPRDEAFGRGGLQKKTIQWKGLHTIFTILPLYQTPLLLQKARKASQRRSGPGCARRGLALERVRASACHGPSHVARWSTKRKLLMTWYLRREAGAACHAVSLS